MHLQGSKTFLPPTNLWCHWKSSDLRIGVIGLVEKLKGIMNAEAVCDMKRELAKKERQNLTYRHCNDNNKMLPKHTQDVA